MKKIFFVFFATGILITSCKEKVGDDDKKAPAAAEMSMPDSATMMKNWMDYMTPGEAHALLAKSDGKWTTESTMWMSPDAPPSITTGTSVNRMALGGRYQISEHLGNYDGMPFQGISTVGYDNIKKAYISTWVDNFGTGIMVMEGTYDAATKTINFKGNMIDPMTKKNTDVRETFQYLDDNTELLEMFMPNPMGEGEFKMMSLKFTRAK